MASNRRFENLFVWNEARATVISIYQMMQHNRDNGFKDQIQRAAVSVMNNIAEGAECGTDAKFINFLNIAKGSCAEVRSMLCLCEDLKYCSKEKREEIQKMVSIISSGISKMIHSISSSDYKQPKICQE